MIDFPAMNIKFTILAFLLATALPCAAIDINIDAGVQGSYVEYREPGVMAEKGWLGGAFLAADTHIHEALVTRLFSSFVAGDLQYRTHPDRLVALRTETPNTIFDLRGEAGWQFATRRGLVTPYAGYGYRRLVDDLPDIQQFPGYRREQVYYYVPIGVDIGAADLRTWDLGVRLEYDRFLRGRNKSLGLRLKQDTGWGCRAALRLTRKTPSLPGDGKLGAELFTQYWNVDDSTPAGRGFYEPRNDSTMVGLRLFGRY